MILNAGGGKFFEDGANSTFGPVAAVKSLDLSMSYQVLFADSDRLLRRQASESASWDQNLL